MWSRLLNRIYRFLNPDCVWCKDTGWVSAVSCNDPFAGPCSCSAGKR